MTPTYQALHFPLNRAAICLDCSELTEVGETVCPACSGGSLFTLSAWLDRMTETEEIA